MTTTRVLAEAIAGASEPLPAFLAGNGISYYGDHGDAVLTEASDTRGHATLTDVTRAWEDAARPAVDAGARVCVLRTAPVMDRRSAPLKQLRLLFKAGLGGRLGSGRQVMPMISLRDWVGAVVHLAEHPTASGPFNLTAPTCPPTPSSPGRSPAPCTARRSCRCRRRRSGPRPGRWLPSCSARSTPGPPRSWSPATRSATATCDAVLAAGLAGARRLTWTEARVYHRAMGLVTDVRVRQPARNDLVGDRFLVAGLGSGFEGTIGVRVLGPGGRVLAEDSAQSAAGGIGIGEFSVRVRLARPPRPGTRLTVQVFGDDPRGGPAPASDLREVEVICFPGSRGYLLYRVTSGDTLTSIVRDVRPFTRTTVAQIVAANPRIDDPDVIRVGQRIRIPLR